MSSDDELRVSLLKQMLRKEYIGRRYGREEHIISSYSGDERNRARKILKSLASNPSVPVGHYKDKTNSYRILDVGSAKDYIESLGGDPEVSSEYDDLRIIG